jgi:nitroreductase / dihydropteridine reductase
MKTVNNEIIDTLEWRYATKKYDKSRKIPNEDFQTILRTLQLVPSSYGLQPLKYLVIENEELRQKLREHSWNQSQITDASHMIVFCTYSTIDEQYIDNHMELSAKIRRVDISNTKGYADFLKKTILVKDQQTIETWNAKQAYIALGHVLQTAASLKIDSTPMEGYDSRAYEEILGLDKLGLKATLVCVFGYRSEEDANQYSPKIRKEMDKLVDFI